MVESKMKKYLSDLLNVEYIKREAIRNSVIAI